MGVFDSGKHSAFLIKRHTTSLRGTRLMVLMSKLIPNFVLQIMLNCKK